MRRCATRRAGITPRLTCSTPRCARSLARHVKQAGSLVAPDRLRFDFVHFQPVTRDELDRIERIVNEQIYRNTPVTTEERSTQEAMAAGAMALFGEKYGDRVRVVSVPGFSMELCGGTHVSATGDIGFFVIVAESGVAAGTRRIEALTGADAVQWAQELRAAYDRTIDALKVNPEQAVEAIERLQTETKRLARELTQAKRSWRWAEERRRRRGGAANDATIDVAGVKLVRRKVADLDKDALRGLADSLKAQIKSGVVVLASSKRRQGADRRRGHARSDESHQGRADRQGDCAHRRRRGRRAARFRRSRRQVTRKRSTRCSTRAAASSKRCLQSEELSQEPRAEVTVL